MTNTVKQWWALPAILAPIVLAQVWWSSTYDLPGGHASDHFMNATAVFGFTGTIAVLVWAVAPSERRQPVLWLLGALIVTAAAFVTDANLRIVDAIGPRRWTDEQASQLGAALPGFDAAHDRVDDANLALSAFAIALAAWLAWRRVVHVGVAAFAALVSLLAGVGVFVLAVATLVARATRLRSAV